MKKKLRQVTDAIHQTIYLSEFESQMMSTAYFHRLHDVYQSSTVYLAFPCNRTKRYEHSCGTMDIAGKMFFYSIANAEEKVLDKLFTDAETQFRKVLTGILKGQKIPSYCQISMDSLSRCFPSVGKRELEKVIKDIAESAFDNFELISDNALDHYIPKFSSDENKRRFLYQCMLESIRILALFHDVGHPPYSHIMESVLGDLYNECKRDIDNDTSKFCLTKAEELVESLSPFYDEEKDNITCLLSKSAAVKSALHEQVGLKLLNLALADIIKEKIADVSKIKKTIEKSTLATYYIVIAEFCIAIFREINPFFLSLHRFIDGLIDADRMDYIVRDTRNSGVDWGKISYKRLLESCKLTVNLDYSDKYYFVSFPNKMVEDINDALIARYKIFSRINFHHRAFKTSAILQRLVYLLAIDYLKKDDDSKCMCPNICDLWCCLYQTLTSYNLYIIQWNDSSLVSHLYHTLADCKPNMCEEYDMSSEEYDEILHMLEEFLLNQKHFHSVFKRQIDFAPILEKVFEELASQIAKVLDYENEKLNADNQNKNAFDSVTRFSKGLFASMVESGDIDGLAKLFPLGNTIVEMLDDILLDFKRKGIISSYLLKENHQRTKIGLPKDYDESNGIYLYAPYNTKPMLYDISVLKKILIQLQSYCLQYIVYIETENVPEEVIRQIHEQIKITLVDEFKMAMENLFSCLQDNS